MSIDYASVCLTPLMGNYRLKATEFLLKLSIFDVQFKSQISGLDCLEQNDYSGLAPT